MTARLVTAVGTLLAGVLAVGSSAGVAGAQTAECASKASDYCVETSGGSPGSPSEPTGTAQPTGTGQPTAQPAGSSSGGPVCEWRQRDVAGPAGGVDGGPFLVVEGTMAPGSVFVAEVCDEVYTGRARWIPPDDPASGPAPAAPLPSPEELASVVRVRLEGNLPAPAVESTPAAGVAAYVGYPSFVSVTNWSGVVEDRECDPTGALCVTVTATPALRWSPGEPAAPVVECAGSGTRFDPTGDPGTQAAVPGACAYPYRLRTAVDGRPAAWQGVVSVEWSLSWSSTSGASGSLAPVTKTAAVPRAVDEVQTVVVSAGRER